MKRLTLILSFSGLAIALFAQNINENLSGVSKSIIDQLSVQNKKTIAIIDFTSPNGDVSELGRSLSNKLRINIAKNTQAITIVNRSVLQNALAEERLFKDGIIDPETAKKIKFIGVEVIILGEISDYGNDYSVEIQLIDTERSDIVGGEILEIPKTESLRRLNEKILKSSHAVADKKVDKKKVSIGEGEVTDFYPLERELGEIKVKIEKVRYSGNKIQVQFKAFNNLETPMNIGLYNGNAGAANQTKINNDGDIYFSTLIKIANHSGGGNGSYRQEMISGKSWVKGSVDFDNLPPLNSIELLQINFYYDDKGWKYQNLILRDIPVEQ